MITQSYQLPLTETAKFTNIPIDVGHKKPAFNHVIDMISSTSWSTDNKAKNKIDDRSKDIFDHHVLKQRQIYEFSVTGTPKPATTNLNDIFITVKTTKLYHHTRLALIIKTWFQLAKDQVSLNLRFLYVGFSTCIANFCIAFGLRSFSDLYLFLVQFEIIQRLYKLFFKKLSSLTFLGFAFSLHDSLFIPRPNNF